MTFLTIWFILAMILTVLILGAAYLSATNGRGE